MSIEPIPAARRSLAIGLFVALQGLMHLVAPAGLALLSPTANDLNTYVRVAFAVLGVCSGQSSLAAVWLGLRSEGSLKRAPTIFLAWAISILGLVIVATYNVAWLHVMIYVLTFSQFLLLLVLLVVFRLTSGKRLVASRPQHEAEPFYQFSLQHVFLWMAGCAAFVGLHRLLLSPDFQLPESLGRFSFDTYKTAGYPMCMSPLLMIPFLLAATARDFVAPWLLVAALALPILTFAESLHPYCKAQGGDLFDFEILMWLNGSHAAWLTANFLLLRLAGFRLERPS